MAITDLDLALAAAEAGAVVVRARHGGALTRIEKATLDFATDVDIEAERVILEVLRAARPDDAVCGEETGRSGAERALRTWYVDPLCGTLNFAAGTREVAVNVALRDDSGLIVGVCADPFTSESFWAGEGRAGVRRHGRDRPLTPSAGSRLVDVNVEPPFLHGPAFRTIRLLADDAFNSRFRPRVLSTTLALGWVAAGRRAAYLTDGDPRDNVHFAAGLAVCAAVGCVVTGLRGEPWDAGAGGLLVAADQAVHDELLALIELQFHGRSRP